MAADDAEAVPFLSSDSPPKREFSRHIPHSWRTSSRVKIIGVIAAVIALVVFIVTSFGESTVRFFQRLGNDPNKPRLHVLIPSTKADINFCKTTLSLSVLDYPDPTLIGWNEQYNKPDQEQGGALIGTKITKSLEYMKQFDGGHDDDLVLIVDPDDIWFQLRPNVLIDRYWNINRLAKGRLLRRLGRRAIERENIEQTIVMGAQKSCSPNQFQSIACYPVPVPPISKNLYGQNTDTMQGKDGHQHFRPRYPDSGFIMGPIKDVRKLFEYAQELVETMEQHPKWDNGSHSSDFLYRGDPQAIFSIIFGEQEFQREVIRQRHRSWFHKVSPAHIPGSVEGKKFKDIIAPDFTHQSMERMDGHPREFGIGLDYWSTLGHSVLDSERDGKHLVFSSPDGLEAQIKNRNIYDCELNLPPRIPRVIHNWGEPFSSHSESVEGAGKPGRAKGNAPGGTRWEDVPLYTQVCLRSIPVMIHNNGNKELLEKRWTDMWFQPHAQKLLKKNKEEQAAVKEGSETFEDHNYGKTIDDDVHAVMWTDKGKYLTWSRLCTSTEFKEELFREH